MPLHPQAAAFLTRRAHTRADHQLSIDELRSRADVSPSPDTVEAVHTVDTVQASGPGGDLRLRIYTPPETPLGAVLYLHGGGHIMGTIDSYDALLRRLTNRVPAVVVAVDYRRAPEHRCPAAVDDAQAAYLWLLDHLHQLTPNTPSRIVIAGDSAGGNNAAVLARRLRDANITPPSLQVLIYPPVDAVAYLDGEVYPSYRDNGAGYGLLYEDGLYYWNHYLGPRGNPAHPDASPLHAPSLANLAPAYVLGVEYDVLRDEDRAYATALQAAGVATEYREWAGHLHGFIGDPATYDDAEPALNEIATAIRRSLI